MLVCSQTSSSGAVTRPLTYLEVGGLGKTLGDTTTGLTNTVGDTTKGAGDTVKGATSQGGGSGESGEKKQTASNPLGL